MILILPAFLFTLFAVISRVTADDCKIHANKCHYPGDFIANFPENIDEMVQKCSEYTLYLKCMLGFAKECDPHLVELLMLNSTLETVSMICDKHSPLFSVVADNGKCAKKSFLRIMDNFEELCEKRIEKENPEEYEKFERLLNETESDKRWCYLDILDLSCAAEQLSIDCGDFLKDIFLHIYHKIGVLETSCGQYEDDAQKFIQAFDMKIFPSMAINEILNFLENEI